jgi:hypothetical protein
MAPPYRRFAFALLASLCALALAAPDAMADKLVIFKNGKAMRVKSATLENKWLKFDLDGENFIAVKASEVQTMEDVAGGSSEGSLTPNQVAAGSGGAAYSPRQNQPAEDGGYQAEVAAVPAGGGEDTADGEPPEQVVGQQFVTRPGAFRGSRALTQQGGQAVRLPGGLPSLTPAAGQQGAVQQQQIINRSLANRNAPTNRQLYPKRSVLDHTSSPEN